MAEAVLGDLIDTWLNGRRRGVGLHFPARLEARFEADTRGERSRMMMLFGTLGFLFGTALYPVISDGLPDITVLCRHLYLGVAMPVGIGASVLMRFDPPPLLREGLTLAANVVCVGLSMYLFAVSRAPYAPMVVAGVTVLLVYSTVGVQLRFGFALCAVLVILLTYGAALLARPEFSGREREGLMMVALCAAIYLMVANWRLEREQRRGYLLMLRETLQREDLSRRNVELDELTRRDPLTGLSNRRAYDAWLTTLWAKQEAAQGRLGLIVIDIDRFKAFNDFYGHAAGDNCLKTIAVCLREQLRGTSDLIARLGGEEFAVLLPGLAAPLCADVAERMRLAVQLLELPNPGLTSHGLVTVSAGVASQAVLPGALASNLFDAADAALYQAKMSGRNQVCMATGESGAGQSLPMRSGGAAMA
jgi:diguanylate cyclase (GGDEF)-like protein